MVLIHSPSPLWISDQKYYYLIGVSLQVMHHFSLAAFKNFFIIFSFQEFSSGVFWPDFLDLSCCCYCCSDIKSYLTLCEPMDYSMPVFPVLHHLLEFAQTHVH